MIELWRASIFGFNIIPTILLCLSLLFWLTTMIGVLDLDGLDVDAEGSSEGLSEGPFHAILLFLNPGQVPLMLFLSFTFLSMWILAVLSRLLLNVGVTLGGILLAPNLLVSLLLTNAVTMPFRGIFRSIRDTHSGINVIGQSCTVLADLKPGLLGQAEIPTEGAPVRINVKALHAEFRKGDSAIVLERDKEKDLYIISPFAA